MKPALRTKLEAMVERLRDLDRLLAAEDATKDLEQFKRLSREHSELTGIVSLYERWAGAERDAEAAKEMAADAQMKAFADDELKRARSSMEKLEAELQRALLPKDPNDERDVFLEIRAGTGGDESALFAGALFRMYARYAERQRWQVEIISESPSELGGYKEVIARIVGQSPYARLKFESGVHRVQRVPETEAQGRIHTSACTVAVLPEADAIDDVVLNPAELRIDTYRASGAGGQHVNKTDSAVRITHLPTGVVVQCQNERSQTQNKAVAMQLLRSRLIELEERKRSEELAKQRGEVKDVAWGSQIRSYVLHPYTMVKDHRTEHEVGDAQRVLDGDIDEFIRDYLNKTAAASAS